MKRSSKTVLTDELRKRRTKRFAATENGFSETTLQQIQQARDDTFCQLDSRRAQALKETTTATLQKILPQILKRFQNSVRYAYVPKGVFNRVNADDCVLELATVFEMLSVQLKGGSGVAAYLCCCTCAV